MAAAVFVGSAACRLCHASLYSAYMKTPMANSSGKVTDIPNAAFTAAGQRYRIQGNKLQFEDGNVPFDFFVGSNKAGRSFLFQREGYLYELPVTYYRRPGGWDASPGYEREPGVRLNRAIDPSCLSCHASRLQAVYGTENRYAEPPFRDDGVSCERCHGPGSDHVRQPRSSPLVNPAALTGEARDSVCAQCHLTGDARVERAGRKFGEYRAGTKLSEYATYFVWSGKTPEMKVTSHAENLGMSRCFRESGGKLWCGTCHEPHTNANRTQAACMGCHEAAHHREQVCAECHMPSSQATDVAHGVTTDHSIRWSSAPVGRTGELTALLGVADDRSLGLAYAELGDASAAEYLSRARPADAAVLVRLAVGQTNPVRAAALYESALRSEPGNVTALVNLGALYGEAGRREQAASLWRRALEANPATEGAALNLAKISPREEALAVLDRYLKFNPASAAARAARASFQ